MKKFLAIALTMSMIGALAGCSSSSSSEAAAPAADDSAAEVVEEAAPAAEGDIEIAVLIKGTDSAFWQNVGKGAEAYAAETDGVNVTVQGPASEADIEDSLTLLENVILSGPDAIVLGSNADAGATAVLADAAAAGIYVVTVDTALPSEDVSSHLATDNYAGGELAAEAMVQYMSENGIALEGTVAIVAAVAGVQTIIDRDGGFIDKLAEIAPGMSCLDPIYVDNEIDTAMTTTENLITAHGSALVGIYADNNHTGDGVARAVEQAGKQDAITVVAFDDDEEELIALANGVIKTLIIQDQHNMGYLGAEYAAKLVKGESVESYVDTGVQVTWAADL
ncbi:substrate-binding domain-containing protein [Chakrabartyella piscis]|uniref:substrate-binding domain-containing protein n=1 Tax=Chakrabartyella piscis TaxID=2918914 RepID=UPI002958A6E9|nr:substrate-binding domain-containing protein [Chakrabartyella piscis]